jgi:putative FmdB family regulatory protein
MPIYEYSCSDCKHQFSHLHKRLGEAAPPCPECQSSKVSKRISTFSARVSSGASSCAMAGSCPVAADGGQQCCSSCQLR